MCEDLALGTETSKSFRRKSVRCLGGAALMYESRSIELSALITRVSTQASLHHQHQQQQQQRYLDDDVSFAYRPCTPAAPLHQFLAASCQTLTDINYCHILAVRRKCENAKHQEAANLKTAILDHSLLKLDHTQVFI